MKTKIKYPNAQELIRLMHKKHLEVVKKILGHTARNTANHFVEISDLIRMIRSEIDTWPTASAVGVEESKLAIQLIIVCDRDIDFQEQAFRALSTFTLSEVCPAMLAHLEDRICVNRSIRQVYGTQYEMVRDGFVLCDTVNPESMDSRRRVVGLNMSEQQTQLIHDAKRSLHKWSHCIVPDKNGRY